MKFSRSGMSFSRPSSSSGSKGKRFITSRGNMPVLFLCAIPCLLKMRDVFGTVYTDEQFADLYPQRDQPAEIPWRLALITVMQCAENLTDRQAADAVRARIDWKYALGLELDEVAHSDRKADVIYQAR